MIQYFVDVYADLIQFPNTLKAPYAAYASYIISCLTNPSSAPKSNRFYVLPGTSFGAEHPRHLPHSVVQIVPKTDKKKFGRPTASEKQKKASRALTELDKWATRINPSAEPVPAPNNTKGKEKETEKEKALFHPPSLDEYVASKDALALSVRADVIQAAEDMTWKKMKDVDRYAKHQGLSTRREGLEKVEKARAEVGGLLALAESEGGQ